MYYNNVCKYNQTTNPSKQGRVGRGGGGGGGGVMFLICHEMLTDCMCFAFLQCFANILYILGIYI